MCNKVLLVISYHFVTNLNVAYCLGYEQIPAELDCTVVAADFLLSLSHAKDCQKLNPIV